MTQTTERPESPARTTSLAQIVAIVGGTKSRTERTLTAGYHQIQKLAPLTGVSRTYVPRDEEGERLPSEYGKVQVRVDEIVTQVADAMARLVDVVATMDETNCMATGDIVIGGRVIAQNVPVTHLMWLEKQIASLRTFVSKLPALDPTREWHYDADSQTHKTDPVQTARTKKVPRNHVRAVATERHPAQVDVWQEDIVVGTWTRVDFSGALPQAEITAMQARVDGLLDAIRQAREQANAVAAIDRPLGAVVMNYLFGDFLSTGRASR